jgi:hypothetical protein
MPRQISTALLSVDLLKQAEFFRIAKFDLIFYRDNAISGLSGATFKI